VEGGKGTLGEAHRRGSLSPPRPSPRSGWPACRSASRGSKPGRRAALAERGGRQELAGFEEGHWPAPVRFAGLSAAELRIGRQVPGLALSTALIRRQRLRTHFFPSGGRPGSRPTSASSSWQRYKPGSYPRRRRSGTIREGARRCGRLRLCGCRQHQGFPPGGALIQMKGHEPQGGRRVSRGNRAEHQAIRGRGPASPSIHLPVKQPPPGRPAASWLAGAYGNADGLLVRAAGSSKAGLDRAIAPFSARWLPSCGAAQRPAGGRLAALQMGADQEEGPAPPNSEAVSRMRLSPGRRSVRHRWAGPARFSRFRPQQKIIQGFRATQQETRITREGNSRPAALAPATAKHRIRTSHGRAQSNA